MTYEEFEAIEDAKREKLVKEAAERANKTYNQGLFESLSFWNKFMYPMLKRR